MDQGVKSLNKKVIVNIIMTIMLPVLMAYSLIGEMFHEIAGIVLFALFIIHLIQNRKWYGSISKGKQNGARIFQAVLNIVLTFIMFALPVSGILMSRHLFSWLPTDAVTTLARESHLLLSYWGFVLMCVHLGTHIGLIQRRVRAKNGGKGSFGVPARIGALIALAAAAYGVFAFIKRQFPLYMFRQSMFAFFDFSEPRVFFFIDYAAIMVLFAFAGFLIMKGLERSSAVRQRI